MWKIMQDAALAVEEWVDEIDALNGDDPLPWDVEEKTTELLDELPVVALLAVLPRGGGYDA